MGDILHDYVHSRYRRGVKTHPGRDRIKNWITTALVPYERKRARILAVAECPLNLHLGCGDTYLEGWVNMDVARPGRKLDLRWDLRRGLPFAANTAGAVFSEHFFEHLDLQSALQLMIECRRVLAGGGIFRTGVPDLERYINAYFGNDSIIDDMRPVRPTKALALGEIFFFHGHRSKYDAETLALMLTEAGFSHVEQSSFGDGELQPSPDSINRRSETLYIEATA